MKFKMKDFWLVSLSLCSFFVLSSCQEQQRHLKFHQLNTDKIYDYQLQEAVRKDMEQVIETLEDYYGKLFNFVVHSVYNKNLTNIPEVFVHKNLYYFFNVSNSLVKVFDDNANVTQVHNEYFSFYLSETLQDFNVKSNVYLTNDNSSAIEINSSIENNRMVQIVSSFKNSFRIIKSSFPTMDDTEIYYKNFLAVLQKLKEYDAEYLQTFEFKELFNLNGTEEEALLNILRKFENLLVNLEKELLETRKDNAKLQIIIKPISPVDKRILHADAERKLFNDYKNVLKATNDFLQKNYHVLVCDIDKNPNYKMTDIIEIFLHIASGNEIYELLHENEDLCKDRTITIYDFHQAINKLHRIIETYKKPLYNCSVDEIMSSRVQEKDTVQIVKITKNIIQILITYFPAENISKTDRGVKNFLILLTQFEYGMRGYYQIPETSELNNIYSEEQTRFKNSIENIQSYLREFAELFKRDEDFRVNELMSLHAEAYTNLEYAIEINNNFYNKLYNFIIRRVYHNNLTDLPEVSVHQNMYYLQVIIRSLTLTKDDNLEGNFFPQMIYRINRLVDLNEESNVYLTNNNPLNKTIASYVKNNPKVQIITFFKNIIQLLKKTLPTNDDNKMYRDNFLVFIQKFREYCAKYLEEIEFKMIFDLTSTEEEKLLNNLQEFENVLRTLSEKFLKTRQDNTKLEITLMPEVVKKPGVQLELFDSRFQKVMNYVDNFFDTNLKNIYCNALKDSNDYMYDIKGILFHISRINNLYSHLNGINKTTFSFSDDITLVKYYMLEEIKELHTKIKNIKESLSSCLISEISPEMQKNLKIQIIHFIRIIVKIYRNNFSAQNDNAMNIKNYQNMLKFFKNDNYISSVQFYSYFNDIEEQIQYKNSLQDIVINLKEYKETVGIIKGTIEESRTLDDFNNIIHSLDDFFSKHYDTVICHVTKNKNQNVNSFINLTMSSFALGCEYYTNLYEESIINQNKEQLITDLQNVTKSLQSVIEEFPERFHRCYINETQHFLQNSLQSQVVYLFRNIVRNLRNNIPSQNTNVLHKKNFLNMMHGFTEGDKVLNVVSNFMKVDDLKKQKELRDELVKIDFELNNRNGFQQSTDKIYDYQLQETVRKDMEQVIETLEDYYVKLFNFVVHSVYNKNLTNIPKVFVHKNLYYFFNVSNSLVKVFDDNANVTQVQNEYFSFNISKTLQDFNAKSNMYLTNNNSPDIEIISYVQNNRLVQIVSSFKNIISTIKSSFPTMEDREIYYKNFFAVLQKLKECDAEYLQTFEFKELFNLIETEEQELLNNLEKFENVLLNLKKDLLETRKDNAKLEITIKTILPVDKKTSYVSVERKLFNDYKRVLEAADDFLQKNYVDFVCDIDKIPNHNMIGITEIFFHIASANKLYEQLHEKEDSCKDRTISIYDFYLAVDKLQSIIDSYKEPLYKCSIDEIMSSEVQEKDNVQIVNAIKNIIQILKTYFPAENVGETDRSVINFLRLLRQFEYGVTDSDLIAETPELINSDSDLIAETPELINSDSDQLIRFNNFLWNLHSNLKEFDINFKNNQKSEYDTFKTIHNNTFRTLEYVIDIYEDFYFSLYNFTVLGVYHNNLTNFPVVFIHENMYSLEALIKSFNLTYDDYAADNSNYPGEYEIEMRTNNLRDKYNVYLTNSNSPNETILSYVQYNPKVQIVAFFKNAFKLLKSIFSSNDDNELYKDNLVVFLQKFREYSAKYLEEFEFKTIFDLISTEEEKLLNNLRKFENLLWTLADKLLKTRKDNTKLLITLNPVEDGNQTISDAQMQLIVFRFQKMFNDLDKFFETNLKKLYCNVNKNPNSSMLDIYKTIFYVLEANQFYLSSHVNKSPFNKVLLKYSAIEEINEVYISIDNIERSISSCSIRELSPEIQENVKVQIIHSIQVIITILRNNLLSQDNNEISVKNYLRMIENFKFVNLQLTESPQLSSSTYIEADRLTKDTFQAFIIHLKDYREKAGISKGADEESRSLDDFKNIIHSLDDFFSKHYDTVICHVDKNENQNVDSFIDLTISFFALGCEYYRNLYEQSIINQDKGQLITDLRNITKSLFNVIDEFPERFHNCYTNETQHFLQNSFKSQVVFLFRNIVRSLRNNIPSEDTNVILTENFLNMMHGFTEGDKVVKEVSNFSKVNDPKQQKVLRDLLVKIDSELRNRNEFFENHNELLI